jgi:hypothetical protein
MASPVRDQKRSNGKIKIHVPVLTATRLSKFSPFGIVKFVQFCLDIVMQVALVFELRFSYKRYAYNLTNKVWDTFFA